MSGFERLAGRYFTERFVTVRIAILTAVTAALAATFGQGPALLHGAACIVVIVMLRIVDDLLDLTHDRQAHPDRALCAANGAQRAALATLAGGGLAASAWLYCTWLAPPQALVAFFALVALLYSPVVGRPARQFGLLLKYPALVLLGAAEPLPAGVAALAWGALLFALEAREVRAPCKARSSSASLK